MILLRMKIKLYRHS
ncbi:hypothetical protein E2C01_093041 [Portunus trituberculatus]|uniref:Uncharacterized protein n=1 Tax=Portunus trituberculatus TaxID=210409 RepID=A0A5B7JZI0_PORTR|nr:hypothetical protein [Portunus trituberculatus]